MSDNWIENLKYDAQGLIPVIAQDHQDGTILMMAWMNRHALELTISNGEVHYWSRFQGIFKNSRSSITIAIGM